MYLLYCICFALTRSNVLKVHALRDDEAVAKKSSSEEDASSAMPSQDVNGVDIVAEKVTSQKRKAKDAKKKAMKRL